MKGVLPPFSMTVEKNILRHRQAHEFSHSLFRRDDGVYDTDGFVSNFP
jgi:hypothetical protein